jgi:hypothetical protein
MSLRLPWVVSVLLPLTLTLSIGHTWAQTINGIQEEAGLTHPILTLTGSDLTKVKSVSVENGFTLASIRHQSDTSLTVDVSLS